ncbi:MAG: hypothetical protein MUF58_12220 [Arcicella sp.]|jgi:hypothetical protein|nr:hypothetical protein [Arcicella sp.]
MKNNNINKIIFVVVIVAVGFIIARKLDSHTQDEKKKREREKIGLPLLDIILQKERHASQIKEIIKTAGYERVRLKDGVMTFQTIRDSNGVYDEYTFDLLGVGINYDDDENQIIIDCDDSKCIQKRNQNYSTVYSTDHQENIKFNATQATADRFKELVEGYQDLKEAERNAKILQ